MSTRVTEGFPALTEKEKQTLRLIVRGHDAKSIARSLGLSVHTINERLRDARRKMAVSSSREAARLLLEVEGEAPASSPPEKFGDTEIGEDRAPLRKDQESAPIGGAGLAHRRSWILGGVFLMTFAFGLLALTLLPHSASTPAAAPTASRVAPDPVVVDAAQKFLTLGDQARWEEGYRATGTAFRKLNTLQAWTMACEQVRSPLGALVSRTLIGQENLPAPPNGYEVVKFRTRFANKPEAVETVTLEREDGSWRVVGVTIE